MSTHVLFWVVWIHNPSFHQGAQSITYSVSPPPPVASHQPCEVGPGCEKVNGKAHPLSFRAEWGLVPVFPWSSSDTNQCTIKAVNINTPIWRDQPLGCWCKLAAAERSGRGWTAGFCQGDLQALFCFPDSVGPVCFPTAQLAQWRTAVTKQPWVPRTLSLQENQCWPKLVSSRVWIIGVSCRCWKRQVLAGFDISVGLPRQPSPLPW